MTLGPAVFYIITFKSSDGNDSVIFVDFAAPPTLWVALNLNKVITHILQHGFIQIMLIVSFFGGQQGLWSFVYTAI
jgi:hypothetical protein